MSRSAPLRAALLLLALATTATAQESPRLAPEGMVRVELAPQEVTVGDRVTATIILVWDGAAPSEAPRFPAFGDRWGDAEVLASGPVESLPEEGGRRVFRQEVTLAAFRPGAVELPPLTLAVPLAEGSVEVATPDDVGFTVRSLLPPVAEPAGEGAAAEDPAAAGEELTPRPAAPPIDPTADSLFPWVLLAFLVAAVATAAWAVRRLARVSPRLADLLRLDPTSEVRAALRRIEPSNGEAAHTALSLALRIYLGRRLGFPAVESTTSELQRRLRQTRLDEHSRRRTVELLRDCDQVKFARHSVEPAVTARRLEIAGGLVDDVERTLAPAEPGKQEAA